MKNVIKFMPAIICFAYLVLYVVNAQSLAAMHTEAELFYPVICIIVSVALLIGMAVYKRFRQFKNKFFCIPFMFMVSGVITLVIGYHTPCCIGG